ncbi:MAG: GntR family transcriptional regulator [Victivallaceae bacterium]|nr:GntR family transcriptional regulator [Victivallaceae bacterium]
MAEREYQKVIDAIRSKLERGELKAGDRLPTERGFAAELSIGRNSAREALRTLGNMGIVRSRQGSGNYLSADPSENMAETLDMLLLMHSLTVRDIHDFRFRQELTVCEMILENSAPDLDGLKKLLDGETEADGDAKIELDRAFHYELIRLAGNRMLVLLMNGILPVYRRWIDHALGNASPDDRQRLHQCHLAVYTGLARRDRDMVTAAIKTHYGLMDKLLTD